MPASEQTWRDTKTLHKVFGVSSLILLASTIWMFAADHDREWKAYQDSSRRIDLVSTKWRTLEFESQEWIQEHDRLQGQLRKARAQDIPAAIVGDFRRELARYAEASGKAAPDFSSVESLVSRLGDAAQDVQTALVGSDDKPGYNQHKTDADNARVQMEEAEGALLAAEQAATNASQSPGELRANAMKEAEKKRSAAEAAVRKLRSELADAESSAATAAQDLEAAEEVAFRRRLAVVSELRSIVKSVKYDEDTLSKARKFKSAELDKAKADLDIAIRDGRADQTPALQEIVDGLKEAIAELTAQYEGAADHRKTLESIIGRATATIDELEKQVADNEADLMRLNRSLAERKAGFIDMYGVVPLPGKRWLEMPILDAFNSPRKIQNLWSDGLEQDINFRKIRRFDRCTTCHLAIDKTMPGSATSPAFVDSETLSFIVTPSGEAEASSSSESGSDRITAEVDEFLGVAFADFGLVRHDDVTISFVKPGSLAARARLRPTNPSPTTLTTAQIRAAVLDPNVDPVALVSGSSNAGVNGLLAGDILTHLGGDPVSNAASARFLLEALERAGKPFEVTVVRGLSHPYTSHPRLDLFVGSLSPHNMGEFACTICHEGQGSATAFKWASHMPDSDLQRREWKENYGWFDNHHWIYPMYSKRFLESGCLKCHHDVVELEPSAKYPEPPAPKLMHGYNVIRKYGCYGCHEVNGFDGPDKRVGPDMRLEPQYFAAALEIIGGKDSGFGGLSEPEQSLVWRLVDHPDDDSVRREIVRLIASDAAAESRRLSDDIHNRIAPLLADAETPGQLRRPGPSLRFVASKLDGEFLYDWIREPKAFRPSTRMPQFFGLWSHLESHGDEAATNDRVGHTASLEQIEIAGIVAYLNDRSQPFSFMAPPPGVDSSTPEEMQARGRNLFQERGCLACHTHKDFPDATAARAEDEIVQGPDLSGIGDKFDSARNPKGEQWLYTWIKNPTTYHARSVMPDLFLSPITHRDNEGKATSVTDPAADIVAYLMASSRTGWSPVDPLTNLGDEHEETLRDLAIEHLREAFYSKTAAEYLAKGIPQSRRSGLKDAEQELLVPDADYEAGERLPASRLLTYVGRKAIAKYGCYGCHDIPGFEHAKPIGTGLADWGRKDPAKLAFEHITHFLDGHGHGGEAAGHAAAEHGGEHAHPASVSGDEDGGASGEGSGQMPEFYDEQLRSGNRIGFIYQKLREPRSYDFEKTDNKRYNERLRMPQFPFTDTEREAVITFVLGLVASPPSSKYVYQPDERQAAINAGRKALEKYNCGGCHILEAERWDISYPAGFYGEQSAPVTYPFVNKHFSISEIEQASKSDRKGMLSSTLIGMPAIEDDGRPAVNDDEQLPLTASGSDAEFSPGLVEYGISLWKPAVIDGSVYQVGEQAVSVPVSQIVARHDSNGGYLTKYLLPHVVAREKQVNVNAKGSEAWGWLPPPLVGEGEKVQSEWLYEFMLDPHPIRPAVVLRMPRFNMSEREAAALVGYFAAMDNANYPYAYQERRSEQHLADADAVFAQQDGEDEPQDRLDSAMQIVVDKNYCIKCHLIDEFAPAGADRAKAPNLANVYKRLRSEYVRDWVAKPTRFLPYTSMPVNIPYDPQKEHFEGVSQELFPGTAVEQLDAVVDLLMNYDVFGKRLIPVAELVEESAGSQSGTAESPASGSQDAPATDAPGPERSGDESPEAADSVSE